MNNHQDSQLNRGRCRYSPKQHTVYVVDEEEVNPNTPEELTAPQIDRTDFEPETEEQSNLAFNRIH